MQVTTDEAQRLAAVRRYQVLDTPPDGAFERITTLAARLFDVPIAIVSIVDADRIWFKSHHGLDVEQIDREPGLCASAVLQDGPWLVNDASTDPRTLANPLVAGEMGLRFYAGVPLTTHDGFNLGTLCVIDQQPRKLTDAEVASLSDLASVVMDELELRLAARRTVELETELRRSAEVVARTLQQSLLPTRVPDVDGLDIAARYHVANSDQVGGDFYDVVPDAEGGCAVVVGDVCGKGSLAASMTGTARWVIRATVADTWTPAGALARLNAVLVNAQQDTDQYATAALVAVAPVRDGRTTATVGGGGPIRCWSVPTARWNGSGRPLPWSAGRSRPSTPRLPWACAAATSSCCSPTGPSRWSPGTGPPRTTPSQLCSPRWPGVLQRTSRTRWTPPWGTACCATTRRSWW
jgi:sigma-B regulation protein RsbU (phosphoserine phosphatase)